MDNFIGEKWTSHFGVLWTTNLGLDSDRTVVLEPVEEALNTVALGRQGEVRGARFFDTGA
ncbi:hypothetical protein COMA1_140002 [Candidatus Nitrospira nitrosa]|uniref:Uncharacterized protein n=1 Tax=Candidatus Nitrospira nitrosa TaxID=1742972 RepID=A0A0S4LAL1_9BACT|nr:hypothetical protein COMA1_140002 [Candidatus Nitrospira nitrosa]